MGAGAGMAIATEPEGGTVDGAGSDPGGREIGVRQSVETWEGPKERGFGFDTITGGRTVGEEAALQQGQRQRLLLMQLARGCDAVPAGTWPNPVPVPACYSIDLRLRTRLAHQLATRPSTRFTSDRRRAASPRSSPLSFFFVIFSLLCRFSLSFESDIDTHAPSKLFTPPFCHLPTVPVTILLPGISTVLPLVPHLVARRNMHTSIVVTATTLVSPTNSPLPPICIATNLKAIHIRCIADPVQRHSQHI